MKKIIGRGVLLLNSTKEQGLKFGYLLSSEGIQLTTLGGEKASLKTLSEALSNPSATVKGEGHLILNALPASPNHAFYTITFEASKIGKPNELFTLRVEEKLAFAHGPQSHFSNLDLTFKYNKIDGLSILPESSDIPQTVTLNLDEKVFNKNQINGGGDFKLIPELNKEGETLIFKAPDDTNIQLDAIGKLSNIEIEVGQSYDRWAQVQALYTFAGTAGDIVTHDISGQGAPSLYFYGEENPKSPYGGRWLNEGIKLSEKGVMASLENTPNSVIESIKYSEAFSIEMWIKSTEIPNDEPAWIFGFRGKTQGKDYAYNFFLGQDSWISSQTNLKANFKFPPLGIEGRTRGWETALESPDDSLNQELTHVVYTCDKEGMQRIFINGVEVAHRHDPDYYNKWGGNPRIVVGSDLIKKDPGNIYKGKPWIGEIQQLAIFNRALNSEEVKLHYLPSLKITGDLSLDYAIAPLKDVAFPFHLSINENDSTLTAELEGTFNIKPQLGFRKIYLECNKLESDPWIFSGRFQTFFWEDFFDLHASLYTPEGSDTNLLELNSSGEHAQPINLPGLGYAKYKDITLRTVNHDPNNVWELSFGAHEEFGLISMVLENAVPEYGNFIMGRPHLLLTDPIVLNGIWIGEEMEFKSEVGSRLSVLENESGETERIGDDIILEGITTFSLPFALKLPAKVDPKTGDTWGEPIAFDAVMEITLEVELLKEGFLGLVKDISFEYENLPMSLPDRMIYKSPLSKMALLGELLEEIKEQSETFFGGLRKHKEDYFIKFENSKPTISFIIAEALTTEIKTLLPNVFENNVSFESTKKIFSLSQNASGCELTINQTNDEFLKVDYLEILNLKKLNASGVNLLKRRIAERLTLDYNQVLYYYYGWDIEQGYIDLQGGMRLKVDLQNYQFVQASDQTANKGFVGSGSFYIPVSSYSFLDTANQISQKIGFDSFLSRLQTEGKVEIHETGAGGLVDVLKAGNRKAFYRLFYPKQFTNGSNSERVVTFLGADNYTDLQEATDRFVAGDYSASEKVTSFFFRGKAMIIPEIQIYVDDKAVYVPIGSTIRQLIERYDDIPGTGLSQDLSAFAGKNRPLRWIHEGVNSQSEYRFINFHNDDDDENSPINSNALDLPLIKGDRFYF